jgi:hypothetical protein
MKKNEKEKRKKERGCFNNISMMERSQKKKEEKTD